MAKYIDADLLQKEIEFAKSVYSHPKRVIHGVADAFRQDGRVAMCDDILKKLDSLPEQPVEYPTSTEMIAEWENNELPLLRDKDFRGDAERMAYNAFIDGFAKGLGYKK